MVWVACAHENEHHNDASAYRASRRQPSDGGAVGAPASSRRISGRRARPELPDMQADCGHAPHATSWGSHPSPSTFAPRRRLPASLAVPSAAAAVAPPATAAAAANCPRRRGNCTSPPAAIPLRERAPQKRARTRERQPARAWRLPTGVPPARATHRNFSPPPCAVPHHACKTWTLRWPCRSTHPAMYCTAPSHSTAAPASTRMRTAATRGVRAADAEPRPLPGAFRGAFRPKSGVRRAGSSPREPPRWPFAAPAPLAAAPGSRASPASVRLRPQAHARVTFRRLRREQVRARLRDSTEWGFRVRREATARLPAP